MQSLLPIGIAAEARRGQQATCRRWLHHHHVLGCRRPRVGRVGRLLRYEGRRAPVRETGCGGVCSGRRWDPGQQVHPGVIDTPIWTKLPASSGSNAPIDANEVAKAGVPLGKAGQAQDIANGVLFLASDASSCRTGAELVIDGGMAGAARPPVELN
jgi:hypothetical protein